MNKLVPLSAVLGVALVSNASIWEVDFAEGLMNGGSQVPPNNSVAKGGELGVGITYNDVSNYLDLSLAYGLFGWPQLEAQFTSAEIRVGAPGETGPVVLTLNGMHTAFGLSRGFFLGGTTISEANESLLLAGRLYINVSSQKYPTGEIRGQLVVVPEPGTWALLAAGLGGLLWLRRK